MSTKPSTVFLFCWIYSIFAICGIASVLPHSTLGSSFLTLAPKSRKNFLMFGWTLNKWCVWSVTITKIENCSANTTSFFVFIVSNSEYDKCYRYWCTNDRTNNTANGRTFCWTDCGSKYNPDFDTNSPNSGFVSFLFMTQFSSILSFFCVLQWKKPVLRWKVQLD